MKQVVFILVIVCAIFCGCKNPKKENNVVAVKEETLAENIFSNTVNMLGSYVGNFGTNKITLLITKITNDSIEGTSIAAGYTRNIIGTIKKQTETLYNIIAREPGENQYDGEFIIILDLKTPNEISGSWKPYNPTSTLKAKSFTLARKKYEYNKTLGVYPIASTRLLEEADVENLKKGELEYMRNEIFARHGYCFKKKKLRTQFEIEDWYVPNSVDVKNDLTETEKKNIALIKNYEQYAEEYGNDFGR
jgi:YARHG domain